MKVRMYDTSVLMLQALHKGCERCIANAVNSILNNCIVKILLS